MYSVYKVLITCTVCWQVSLTWNTLVVDLEVVALLLTWRNLTAKSAAGKVDAAPLLTHTGIVLVLSVGAVPGGVGTVVVRTVSKEDPVDPKHGPLRALNVYFGCFVETGTCWADFTCLIKRNQVCITMTRLKSYFVSSLRVKILW